MNDVTTNPTPAPAGVDPLAIFASSTSEKEGVMIDIEHPTTGDVLMRFRVARFGGSNSTKIVKVERELKSKLTQGQRRAIDAGAGDPDVVTRLNRMTFVRTTILGYEPVDPSLREKYPARDGAEAYPVVDQLFADYPKMYDLVSEKATDEETYAAAETGDDIKN
jgi:hypothetical protein